MSHADPTPDDLATLARAMGYTVTLDDSGGYGVVRVLVEDSSASGTDGYRVHYRPVVFRPHLDAAQAWEVMAWLMRHEDTYGITPDCISIVDDGEPGYRWFAHDGTAAGIRRAVVEAAIRVAEES